MNTFIVTSSAIDCDVISRTKTEWVTHGDDVKRSSFLFVIFGFVMSCKKWNNVCTLVTNCFCAHSSVIVVTREINTKINLSWALGYIHYSLYYHNLWKQSPQTRFHLLKQETVYYRYWPLFLCHWWFHHFHVDNVRVGLTLLMIPSFSHRIMPVLDLLCWWFHHFHIDNVRVGLTLLMISSFSHRIMPVLDLLCWWFHHFHIGWCPCWTYFADDFIIST